MNINNNTALFVSITWHQKDPLGCVVNSHGQTNDSYNKCIHGSCLLCNYVTKPFGILQRVIVSQRVLIIPYIWTQQKSTSFLSEKFVAKFSDVIFNFPVSWKSNYQTKFQTTYQCAAFKKKMFLLFSTWGNVATLQTTHGNIFILCQMGLLPDINFLSSKQNRRPKIDPKMLKQ